MDFNVLRAITKAAHTSLTTQEIIAMREIKKNESTVKSRIVHASLHAALAFITVMLGQLIDAIDICEKTLEQKQ